jgi:hypothetical protein
MLCFTLLKSQFAPVAARAALAELLAKPEDGMASGHYRNQNRKDRNEWRRCNKGYATCGGALPTQFISFSLLRVG